MNCKFLIFLCMFFFSCSTDPTFSKSNFEKEQLESNREIEKFVSCRNNRDCWCVGRCDSINERIQTEALECCLKKGPIEGCKMFMNDSYRFNLLVESCRRFPDDLKSFLGVTI